MTKEVKTASKDGAKKERTGGGLVREQIPPIFKVVSGGVTIDFTDKLEEAKSVFREAYAKPKFLYSVFGRDVQCVHAAY